jgi:integrase
MSVHKTPAGKYHVRWREGNRNRQRTFDRKRDADLWDAEVTRRRQLGALHTLDAGRETLDEYAVGTWARAHTAHLAEKTKRHYSSLYGHHIAPYLGPLPMRDLTPEVISRWQADRLASGAGRSAVRQALELLGTILQRAADSERLPSNPVRRVTKAPRPRRVEVRPLAPATVEAMRDAASPRDAALISVLAYSGLRPGEALALRWGDVREQTLLVERALSVGDEEDTKTRQHRTVRLLAPLRADLLAWRLASGRPSDDTLVFPGHDGNPWTEPAYQSWRRRAFRRALTAAGVERATPYHLRHSFASLLLHEGRNVMYVARQLGHDARLTLTRYGHVMDELEDAPLISAEDAIAAARGRDVRARFAPRAVGRDHARP